MSEIILKERIPPERRAKAGKRATVSREPLNKSRPAGKPQTRHFSRSENGASIWFSLFFIVNVFTTVHPRIGDPKRLAQSGEPGNRYTFNHCGSIEVQGRPLSMADPRVLYFFMSRERIMTASEVEDPRVSSFTTKLSYPILSDVQRVSANYN